MCCWITTWKIQITVRILKPWQDNNVSVILWLNKKTFLEYLPIFFVIMYNIFFFNFHCKNNGQFILTTEWTSSILDDLLLFMLLTNLDKCSKCLVISVAITMSIIDCLTVRKSSLETQREIIKKWKGEKREMIKNDSEATWKLDKNGGRRWKIKEIERVKIDRNQKEKLEQWKEEEQRAKQNEKRQIKGKGNPRGKSVGNEKQFSNKDFPYSHIFELSYTIVSN